MNSDSQVRLHIKRYVSIIDVMCNDVRGFFKVQDKWVTRCPFCHDPRNTFRVNDHMDIYYCSECHEVGDQISFIERTRKCNFHDAVCYLIDNFPIPLNETGKCCQRDDDV